MRAGTVLRLLLVIGAAAAGGGSSGGASASATISAGGGAPSSLLARVHGRGEISTATEASESVTLLSSAEEARRVRAAVDEEELRRDAAEKEEEEKKNGWKRGAAPQFEGAAGGTLERATWSQKEALEQEGKFGHERFVRGWGRVEDAKKIDPREEQVLLIVRLNAPALSFLPLPWSCSISTPPSSSSLPHILSHHTPPTPSPTLWPSFSLPISAFIRLTLSHSRKRHPPAPPSLCCSAQVKSILEMERERRKKDLKIEKLKLRGWPFILSFLLPSIVLLVPCPPSLRCVKVTSLNRLRQ